VNATLKPTVINSTATTIGRDSYTSEMIADMDKECVQRQEVLERPVEQRDDTVVSVITRKLDAEALQPWE
jgi:hypothetical protein